MSAAPMLSGRSPAAMSMLSELEYQKAVTAILLITTRPLERNPRGPMFSQSEIEEMDRAMSMGLSAAGFAARLVARDKASAESAPPVKADEPPTDTAILERLIARNCVGAVRHYDGSGWCYGGQAYPDARAALAVFMERTK